MSWRGGTCAAALRRVTGRCGSNQNGHVWKVGHLMHSGRRERGEIRRYHKRDVRKVGYIDYKGLDMTALYRMSKGRYKAQVVYHDLQGPTPIRVVTKAIEFEVE